MPCRWWTFIKREGGRNVVGLWLGGKRAYQSQARLGLASATIEDLQLLSQSNYVTKNVQKQ